MTVKWLYIIRENGTDYTALPEMAFEFLSQTSMDFGSGDNIKFLRCNLRPDMIDGLGSDLNYVLPLSLSSTDSVMLKNKL